VARRNGVEIEEFGIFFPPRLYSHTTKAGWVFSVNALPLGGFVKLKGEHDSDTEHGTFGAASLMAKSKILLAGVTMNLITGLVLLTILAVIGMPQVINNQYVVKSNAKVLAHRVIVNDVVSGSPAAKAGLRVGDQLTEFVQSGSKDTVAITQADKLRNLTQKFAGKTVIVHYERNGKSQVVQIHFLPPNSNYELGVGTQQMNLTRSTWSAPLVALGLGGQLIVATLAGLGHSLAGLGGLIAGAVTHNTVARQNGQSAATANITGPVGIFAILRSSSALGYQFVLFIVAYISLVLAFMNILPIPVVDGGRLYVMLIMRALKRPLTAKREEAINLASVIVLLFLFVLITIADVKRYY
ncbi:MAG TPA: site-2 protease family protein, partial [Candidatus Dormibacteraeota bacterium]|nr:site-2 protease family protein [Candidatus Dormibacteraeota bacterium]